MSTNIIWGKVKAAKPMKVNFNAASVIELVWINKKRIINQINQLPIVKIKNNFIIDNFDNFFCNAGITLFMWFILWIREK